MKAMRILGIALLIPLGLFAVLGLAAFLIYPTDYVMRTLRWGESDVYDYQKFASHPLGPASQPYQFPAALNESTVKAAFEADPLVSNLEDFMEQHHTQALLVLRDGELIYEGYFNGANGETMVTSFSAAKSFDSAMIGVALKKA